MGSMKVSQLDDMIVNALVGSDNPEITRIERLAGAGNANHNRVRVWFANDTSAVVMVRRVEGPGVTPHADYELPAAVI